MEEVKEIIIDRRLQGQCAACVILPGNNKEKQQAAAVAGVLLVNGWMD